VKEEEEEAATAAEPRLFGANDVNEDRRRGV
jgi:hypothetical protein